MSKNKAVTITVLACVLFVVVVFAGSIFKRNLERSKAMADQLEKSGLVVLSKPRQLSPFKLTNHHGKPFSRDDLNGQWSILFFGFTHCPHICPTTLSKLAKSMAAITDEQLKKRISVYFVTADPERDTVRELRRYTPSFSPDFTGITGDLEALGRFALEVGVAFAKVPSPHPSGYTIDHSTQLVVLNPRGHHHAFIKAPHDADAIAWAMQELDQDFKELAISFRQL